jgi:organic radical activating enzyme
MIKMLDSSKYIPVSYLGNEQVKDIENSSGIIEHDYCFRVCTILKGPKLYAANGDKSPYRMAEIFGKDHLYYNDHVIFQTSTCPYKCEYCYVDRLENDKLMTPKDIVHRFSKMRKEIEEKYKKYVNVLHMMGGDPAVYAKFWPIIRKELDNQGFKDVILYSDCLMIENNIYGVKPWEYIDIGRFVLVCSLKGSNWKNMFNTNGKYDKFNETLAEAVHYLNKDNVYFTIINYDHNDLPRIYNIFEKNKVDLLNVVHYEVTKRRYEGIIR